jgi:hypothetical protein
LQHSRLGVLAGWSCDLLQRIDLGDQDLDLLGGASQLQQRLLTPVSGKDEPTVPANWMAAFR